MMANHSSKKRDEAKVRTWLDELDMVSRPATLFLGALGVAVVLLGLSAWFRHQQENALTQAQQARNGAYARFQNVETEKVEIGMYQPRFVALQAAGMVGDENRLAWIERIKQIQTTRKLMSASYEIEAQQALVMSSPMALGDYQLRGSRMHFELGLVHELDLFHFIDDMRSAGLFTVQDCKINRKDVPAEAVGVARLTADCHLVWVSLGAAPPPAAATLKKEWP